MGAYKFLQVITYLKTSFTLGELTQIPPLTFTLEEMNFNLIRQARMNHKSAPNDFDEIMLMHFEMRVNKMFLCLNTKALTFQKEKHFSIYRFLKSGAKKA